MGNHFHLKIQPQNDESLSAIMQWIMGVFAMAWNRTNGISGHVWGGRIFSRIVANRKEFMQVFSYIDKNPTNTGQTTNPGDWKYDGIWHRRSGTEVYGVGKGAEKQLRLYLYSTAIEHKLLYFTPQKKTVRKPALVGGDGFQSSSIALKGIITEEDFILLEICLITLE